MYLQKAIFYFSLFRGVFLSLHLSNIYIYIRIVRKIKEKGYDVETGQIIRLYLIGQLATYLVRNYKYTELDMGDE